MSDRFLKILSLFTYISVNYKTPRNRLFCHSRLPPSVIPVSSFVIPVKTGIQIFLYDSWIPAGACPREGGGGNDRGKRGMTEKVKVRKSYFHPLLCVIPAPSGNPVNIMESGSPHSRG